jgi:hypothetical protein
VLDISDQVDTIVAMLACHRSQVFEWLPYLDGVGHEVPEDEGQRRSWVRAWYARCIRPRADRFRQALIATYGGARGSTIEYAEAYEISQYAAPADQETLRRLFLLVRYDS